MASINVRDGAIATRHTAGYQILETRPSNNNAVRAEFFSNRPVPGYNRLGEVKKSRTNLNMMNQLLPTCQQLGATKKEIDNEIVQLVPL